MAIQGQRGEADSMQLTRKMKVAAKQGYVGPKLVFSGISVWATPRPRLS